MRGWELEPVELALAVPGEHNRANAAAALAALELAGVARDEAERALAGFTGVGRRFELVGERGGVRVLDDYGHNPTEIAATLATARELEPRTLIAVYQPHVFERTRQLYCELGVALGLADAAIVTDVIGGRDAPRARREREARPRPGAGADAPWLGAEPRRRRAARARLGAPRRRGRHARRRGAVADRACDRRRGWPNDVEIERGVPLAQLTTIGTGGPARAFARPRTSRELAEALRLRAATKDSTCVVVGLGSNFLAADDGVDALVLRLEGELATVEIRDDGLDAGGGATNAVCLHRAREAGLGGLEFACAIPGTAGGGVSDERRCVRARLVGRPRPRARRLRRGRALARRPTSSASTYRRSALRPGRGRRAGRVPARAAPAGRDQGDRRRARRATEGDAADEQADLRERLQEPRQATLGAGRMLELCGLKGHRIGGALVSPKHANFIENAGGATSADCVALMVEARRRARERVRRRDSSARSSSSVSTSSRLT